MYVKNSYSLIQSMRSVRTAPAQFCEQVMPLVNRFRDSLFDWDDITIADMFRIEFSTEPFPCSDQWYDYVEDEILYFQIGPIFMRVTIFADAMADACVLPLAA